MISGRKTAEVYLVTGYTDMRCGINSLSMKIQSEFDLDPFSGRLFVFCNRNSTIIKILYWDLNGFCLWQKRLEKQKFKWPTSNEQVLHIEKRQLLWLLDGLNPVQIQGHRALNYTDLF